MFFRLVILISFFVVIQSCDFISPKRTALGNSAVLDTVINYNAVDVYPLFLDCNNCDSFDKQNLCFEMELVRRLAKLTNKTKIGANIKRKDTIMVDILVNTKGVISVVNIHKSDLMIELLPDLDSLLFKSIAALPSAVQPSLKRGIPVNTMFKLPIVVAPNGQ